MDPLKKQAIDAHNAKARGFAANYEQLTDDPYSSCFRYTRKRLAPLLDRYIGSDGHGKKLLDVGCGPGIYLSELRKRNYDVAGIDGSEEMLGLAAQNAPGAVLKKGDVDELPFEDASFDMVLCIEVLRYLPRMDQCIREMARVLKPGGMAIATASPWLSSNAYALINRLGLVMPLGSLVRLKQTFTTSGALKHDFLDAGFASATVHGVYTGPINWVERLAPRKVLHRALAAWEPIDEKLADAGPLKELSNMFLVSAIKG